MVSPDPLIQNMHFVPMLSPPAVPTEYPVRCIAYEKPTNEMVRRLILLRDQEDRTSSL
jgi:hypothetical protein